VPSFRPANPQPSFQAGPSRIARARRRPIERQGRPEALSQPSPPPARGLATPLVAGVPGEPSPRWSPFAIFQRRPSGLQVRRRASLSPGSLSPRAGAPESPFAADPFASADSPGPAPAQVERPHAGFPALASDGHLLAVTQERRERFCSLLGLMVKLGLVAVTGVSLVQIAATYQQRMDSNGEIVAVLELEKARLERARQRFDALFNVEGEQRLIREQSQWIAPNRLRVIWQSAEAIARPQSRP